MKKALIRHIETIIAICLFILTFACYTTQAIETTFFLGLLGAIASVYFGFLRIKIENDRIFKELFSDFNSRYDSSFNNLINDLRSDTIKKLDDSQRNIIIDYFNLCSEEYLWYLKNRIPNKVWIAWKAGINHNLTIPAIKEVFLSLTQTEDQRKSYYGLVEDLKK